MTRLASVHEGIPCNRRPSFHRLLSDSLPVQEFLSFLILDEAAVLMDVEVISGHLPAYRDGAR
jgi:hypothetical protein